jgi:alkylation response protein AidB-like acyl-CoA dehydrogenase
VVADAGDSQLAAVVPLAELTVRPIRGIDPSYRLVEVYGEMMAPVEPVDWAAAVALGQLALGHELVGASRKMLELAREHGLQRTQSGRPISQFQAVRHRLADTLLAIETADALLHAAWEDASPETAAMAKALAGRSARTVARHCQQVLAGIGFTTEHAFHRYFRRVYLLDQLFGSSRTITADHGRRLLADRRLPPLQPL